jgi:aspartate racemase
MHTFSLGLFMQALEDDDWAGVAELMLRSANKLKQAGADFLICPDNTIHQALPLVIPKSPLPWLHIAEAVAIEASKQHLKKLLILGTTFLMDGPVYSRELDKVGIGHMTPDEKRKKKVSNIIFQELVLGEFSDSSRRFYSETIDEYRKQGCDGVVLGCTEIPLLVRQEHSSLPILDSTRILARAALAEAIKDE